MSNQHEREGIVVLDKQHILSVDSLCIPEEYKDKIDGFILPNGLLEDRTEKLAYDIACDYKGLTVHLLCILKGAHVFFSALTRSLKKFGVNYCYDFIKVKSYSGSASTGNVQIDGMNLEYLKGKHVIVVEDIIDTGKTMQKLIPLIESYGTLSCKTCVLSEKDTPLSCGYKSNYCGFIIPNYFIIGNGYDFDEVMREIRHSVIISEYGIEYYTEHKIN